MTTETVLSLLSDAFNSVLTLDDGTAILVDWYEWDRQPKAIVEARFGDVWVPLECNIQSLNLSIGRDLTTEPVEAGVARIALDNTSGIFTDFQGDVAPLNEGTEIRVRLQHPRLDYDPETQLPFTQTTVWWGYVQEWEQRWSPGEDVIVVTAVDAIALLNEQGGALGWTSGDLGDTVGERMAHLFARVGLTVLRMYLDYSDVTLANPELQATSVLDEAHRVALTDGGRLFAECDNNGFYFVYLGRSRWGGPPDPLPAKLLLGARATRTREVGAENALPVYTDRPGQDQDSLPLFSDMCGANSDPRALPYTDLEWNYRGWEIPSIVAVSNIPPPAEEDRDGEPLPPRWPEVGSIAAGEGRRHNVVEFANMEFIRAFHARRLARLYAKVMSRTALDVRRLEVRPELDSRLWDVVTTLRQGDWIRVERNLTTDRFAARCSIEGIEWELTPRDGGGQPEWVVTYKLHAMFVKVSEIPIEDRPPVPPANPTQPKPLPPVSPQVTVADFGTTFGTLPPTEFIERGFPQNQLNITINDPAHHDHFAYVYSDDYGVVQMPLRATGTYNGDNIHRQFGGVPLAPSTWVAWVQDATSPTRLSNQIIFEILPWDAPDITSVDWQPLRSTRFTYTDDRYPQRKPRVFARGREGTLELPVYNWSKVGNPTTTNSFTLEVNTGKLLPDDWEFWIQDPAISDRRSEIIELNKPTPVPSGLRLGTFDPDVQDIDAWDEFPVVWNAVPDADRYIFEYRRDNEEWRTRRPEANLTTLPTGTNRSTGVEEYTYKCRVKAVVNSQESVASPIVTITSGYPYYIRRDDYSVSADIPITGRGQTFGPTIPNYSAPSWTQQRNPDRDYFVGYHITRLEVIDLATWVNFGGEIVFNSLRPGDPETRDLKIRFVTNGIDRKLMSTNPSAPKTGSFSIEQIGSGRVGLKLEGATWSDQPQGTKPATNSGLCWMDGNKITAVGYLYVYVPPKKPREQ